MKILEIKYYRNYGNFQDEAVIDHVKEDNYQRMLASGVRYYRDIEILKDLGEMDLTYLPAWLKIGKKNSWIREADDPHFDENMFFECKTIEYLIGRMRHGNWCLGQAFYYKDLCFINQIEGGDEWLTIRRDISFESASCGRMIERDGEEYFKLWVEDCLEATDEELKTLNYTKKSSDLKYGAQPTSPVV